MPDPKTDGRMPEKLKALRRLREHFGDRALVEGSCAGPYSCVGLLFGLEEAMLLAIQDPDLFFKTCDFFVELEARWIEAQIQAGAHAIWLGDCNAFSGMLSLAQYKKYAFPSCKRLVDRARACGAIVHIHNSEIMTPYLLAEAELGVDIVNCGPGAGLAEACQALAGKCCLSGNLDPIEVLTKGTPGEVAREAERIVRTGYAQGGYLFNTGEMNPREVPVENMRAMIESARRTANTM
jgi:uroporphyrinogen decarboxylase